MIIFSKIDYSSIFEEFDYYKSIAFVYLYRQGRLILFYLFLLSLKYLFRFTFHPPPPDTSTPPSPSAMQYCSVTVWNFLFYIFIIIFSRTASHQLTEITPPPLLPAASFIFGLVKNIVFSRIYVFLISDSPLHIVVPSKVQHNYINPFSFPQYSIPLHMSI